MNTRELLLNTAIKLFSEKGFDRTSTNLISKTAGLGTGTLFKHFSNKEELINETYIHCKSLFATGIEPLVKKEASCHDALESIWIAGFDWVFANPLEYAFLMQFEGSTAASRLAQDKVHEKLKFIDEILLKGTQDGSIVDLPVHFLLTWVGSQFKATYLYITENPDQSKDELISMTYALVWKGLKI